MISRQRLTLLICRLAILLASPCLAAVRSNFVAVAVSGQAAPGVAGATFSSFAMPCLLNNEGAVAFVANCKSGTTTRAGIWSGAPGNLQLVACQNDPVPDLDSGITYKSFSTLRLTAGGFLAFGATVQGTGVASSNDTCFLAGHPGNIRLVAREGSPAPGCQPGEVHADLGQLAAYPFVSGRPGEVVFRGNILNIASNGGASAIWGGAPDSIRLLVREAASVPGMPGVVFGHLWTTSPRLNPDGQFAFDADLSGEGVTLNDNAAFFTGTTGGVQLVFREGQTAGAVPGATFISFANGSVNVNTQYCLVARLNTGSSSNDSAILAGPAGGLSALAREGSQVPGFPAGVVFRDLGLVKPVWNENGQAAFTAQMAGPGIDTTNRTGVWVANDRVAHLLCRPRDPAPDCEPGVVFHSAFSGTFDIPVQNAYGNVAFTSMIEGPGIGLTNNECLFAGPPHFVRLVLQRADGIDLSPGDRRTVHTFSLVDGSAGSEPSGGQDGRSRCLNDGNKLIFAVTFVAGQGAAIFMLDDITDPLGLNLPTIAGREFGWTQGENPADVTPRWTPTNGQFGVTHRCATNETYLETVFQWADSPDGPWQDVSATNHPFAGVTNLPPGVELRQTLLPANDGQMKFFRSTVRSRLWEQQ